MPEDILLCAMCTTEWERPFSLASAQFQQNPFVCPECRCKDCGIVLGFECDCEQLHAERSKEDPSICVECVIIRARVLTLDPDLLELRNAEILEEQKNDPTRGFKRKSRV